MMLNKVSLNTIGLNRIGLNRIGKPSRGSSDRPYIDPEVLASLKAVCICYGKSNDDPDRAIVKNLVDPDNPFVISNAVFKLNSGFGKYEVDFTVYNNQNVLVSPNKIVSIAGREFISLLPYTELSKTISSYKIKVTGLIGELSYWYRNQDGSESRIIITKDGIYQLSTCYNVENGQGSSVGFNGYSESSCTIEQIPSFEGAFVTDGIDDLITSTKTVQEMLGGSTEFTAVSMIHLISPGQDVDGAAYTNYIRTSDNYWTSNIVSNTDKTGIYGYSFKQGTPTVIDNILGDKNDYTTDKSSDTSEMFRANFSVEGFEHAISGTVHASSVAWYWTIIANKVLTTDQINQVIAYFNLDRTLKPDILCDVKKQGITNDNHAEFGDKLIDFSGNGRDIQLNNIAWDGDSGIGKYNYPNWKVTATIANTYSTIVNYPTVNGTYSINVNGVSELMQSIGLHLEIKYTTSTGIIYNDIKQDGVYSYILPDGATDLTLRFGGIPGIVNEPCNITITQIPSHAGALCLDGVNDFGKVTGMPIYKDYTVIADYERFYLEPIAGGRASILSKSSKVGDGSFIFNLEDQDGGKACYTFGEANGNISDDITRIIRYQSKYYNTKTLSIGTAEDNDFMVLGKVREVDSRHFCGAIYSLMSFPYSMSEFLIERQLKKHKLGTLYPDMVEFRPVIKQDNRIKSIKYYIDGKTANIGQYYPIGTGLGIAVETVKPYMVKSLKVNGVNTIPNADYKGFNARLDSKSPQKITMDIQVDSSLVQWNPIITSTAELTTAPTFAIRGTSTLLKPGDWIPKNSEIWVIVTMNNLVDELRQFSLNGTFIHIPSSSYNPDTGKYGFPFVIDNESPQNINITIDEYIRYEDIVQPYPVLLRFNDENGNEVSWGGKFRVGSTITRIGSIADPESNLLNGLYSVSGLSLNGKAVTSTISIVEKQMVFKTTATWLLDNSKPKCILSPSRLRIPNSSYKLLGYIPDISGHGNHGVIHNSAYAEGSGVNEDGSYQFDGVDDFVTIPTVTGGKQVLMKVNWQSSIAQAMLYDQRGTAFAIWNSDKFNDNEVDTVPAYSARNGGNTYIDGILNKNILASQLRNITHNIVSTNNMVNENSVSPNIGCALSNSYYSQMSLYDFMLFDNISTDDKIKELNEYVGIEAKVELPPYYWDAYGKTNLDADKATIQQRGVAVGDYDLTNYNHAYDKMSGYGGYSLGRFDKSWASSSSNNTSVIVVSRNPYDITLKKLGGNSDWEFNNAELKVISNPVSVKFKSNKNIRVTCDYHYYPVGGNSEGTPLGITSKDLIANKDAIITISPISQENIDKYNIDVNRGYYLIYFQLSSTLAVNEEVTIEMLPLYPNGLVYDGVTDYSENANIPAFTDYTYIFKREFKNLANSATIAKSPDKLHGGAFVADYNGTSQFSFGQQNDNLPIQGISWQTKNSFNGTSINSGTNTDDKGITIGRFSIGYANMVFYKLILYPKTIPLLQINFLKNMMERDEIIDLNNPIFIQE